MTESASPLTCSPVVGILCVAAYKFVLLDELPARRLRLSQLCKRLELKGTVMLSNEGINLFISGTRANVDDFLNELRREPCFADLSVKESVNEHQPFNRMLVKIKREIIAFGIDSIRPAERTSPKLSAQELHRWLDEGRTIHLLDVRNDYEIALGTFRGAIELGIKHFRDFPEVVKRLPEEIKKQPTVMFCTGGIRCEKAGPYMEQLGFEQIYQLDGGILKYFEECGGQHYDGDCFVFDQRVAVGPSLEPTGVAMCFACLHALTLDDQESELYSPPDHCPYCYRTLAQKQSDAIAARRRRLNELVRILPGSVPYENRRAVHVPRKFTGLPMIDFLDRWCPGYTREAWQADIDRQRITRESVPVLADRIVSEGESFVHVIPNTVEPPVNANIDVLYEDDAIVIVNKPAPLPSHPCGRFNRNTLAYMLEHIYYPEKLRMAHRLDANTSGLVLLSRKHSIAKRIQAQFSDRTVEKHYLARVVGNPASDLFDCDLALTDEPNQFGVRTLDPDGVTARTEFSVIRRYDDGTTLLDVYPITGRTNQIRIHLSHLGLPICNDPLYASPDQLGDHHTLHPQLPQMRLHAWKLTFHHPISNQRMSFEAPRPDWSE